MWERVECGEVMVEATMLERVECSEVMVEAGCGREWSVG